MLLTVFSCPYNTTGIYSGFFKFQILIVPSSRQLNNLDSSDDKTMLLTSFSCPFNTTGIYSGFFKFQILIV